MRIFMLSIWRDHILGVVQRAAVAQVADLCMIAITHDHSLFPNFTQQTSCGTIVNHKVDAINPP
jgi:hypothetical protein